MALLIDAAETAFGTDFAIVMARQEVAEADNIPTFAYTEPGIIRLEAGNKYSRVHIRLERWDERPPALDGWEDTDLLPFAEVPEGGRLLLHGFDPGDSGLDITGFGTGRVQVFASGRHRYSYGDASLNVDELPPEEWLLRLYPDGGNVDPMAGGPRRIAGAGGLSNSPSSPWVAALRAYRTCGWDSEFFSSHGYYLVNHALYAAGSAVTRLRLASLMVRLMAPWQLGGGDAESVEVPPRPSLQPAPDPLAAHSGRESIATTGEAIDAMVDIGLLLVEERAGSRLLIPNPSPEPVWSRTGKTGDELRQARTAVLGVEYYRAANVIEAAAKWCPAGLTASPRAMAIRWCTSVEDVVAAIHWLVSTEKMTADRELDLDVVLNADEPITLRVKGRTFAT